MRYKAEQSPVELAIELLTPTNHDLYKLFKARCDAGYPVTMIAAEIGIHVDDLCDWVLKVYREPKPHKQKPYESKDGTPIGRPMKVPGNGWSVPAHVRKHLDWERQRAGARAALEAAGK